jgi:hypothetical protein
LFETDPGVTSIFGDRKIDVLMLFLVFSKLDDADEYGVSDISRSAINVLWFL